VDIAKWESPKGKYWVVLRRGNVYTAGVDYYYGGSGCGGGLGFLHSDAEAIAAMQRKVDAGQFLPDKARMPMRFTDLRLGAAV